MTTRRCFHLSGMVLAFCAGGVNPKPVIALQGSQTFPKRLRLTAETQKRIAANQILRSFFGGDDRRNLPLIEWVIGENFHDCGGNFVPVVGLEQFFPRGCVVEYTVGNNITFAGSNGEPLIVVCVALAYGGFSFFLEIFATAEEPSIFKVYLFETGAEHSNLMWTWIDTHNT